jgi:hypothetical protein
MATEKQIEANKRNAQKSTGPTTEEGRSRSSRNALKHGLTAEQVTIKGEDPKQFEAFRGDILESLCPQGAIEEQLAERIVFCWWRLRRVSRMEADIVAEEHRDADEFNASSILAGNMRGAGFVAAKLIAEPFQNLSRYETTIERSLHRALHELERWQARRKGEAVMAPIAVDVTHSAGDERESATGVTIEHANGQNGAQEPRNGGQEPRTVVQQVRQRTRPTRPPSAG